MLLSQAEPKKHYTVTGIASHVYRTRLMEMGFCNKAIVYVVQKSKNGSMIVIIRREEIALNLAATMLIEVKNIEHR